MSKFIVTRMVSPWLAMANIPPSLLDQAVLLGAHLFKTPPQLVSLNSHHVFVCLSAVLVLYEQVG